MGTTTSCANGLAAGVYYVTVTDANGITASCCYTVTEPPALSINVIVFDAPTCGGLGSFSLFPVVGGSIYHKVHLLVFKIILVHFQTMGFQHSKYPARRLHHLCNWFQWMHWFHSCNNAWTCSTDNFSGCNQSFVLWWRWPIRDTYQWRHGAYTIEMRISFPAAASTTIQQYSNMQTDRYSSSLPMQRRLEQYTIVVTDANGLHIGCYSGSGWPALSRLHVSFTPPSVDQCDGTITAYGSGGTPFNLFYPTAHVPYNILIQSNQREYFNAVSILKRKCYRCTILQLWQSVVPDLCSDNCRLNGCTRTIQLLECEWQQSTSRSILKLRVSLLPKMPWLVSLPQPQITAIIHSLMFPVGRTVRDLSTIHMRCLNSTWRLFPFQFRCQCDSSFIRIVQRVPNDIHRDLNGLNPWFATPLYGNNSIVSGLSAPWTENTVTWNGAPAANGGLILAQITGDNTHQSRCKTVSKYYPERTIQV